MLVRPLVICLLIGLASVLSVSGAEDWPAVLRLARLPGPAPGFTLRAVEDGAVVSNADFAGRLIVLHFWATWCEPCRHELPALAGLSASVADTPIAIVMVAVDEDVTGSAVAAFARGLGVHLPTYLAADGDVPEALWTWGVPVTYLIGTDGALIGRMRGPRPWQDAKLQEALEALAGSGGRD
ncbi:MAG: TlpA disulfide reductase family protein [Gammaproteobacteria bacterium]